MKKSEELFQAAASEDNDLKAMGIRKKAVRERNLERSEELIEQLRSKYSIVSNDPSKFTFSTETYGTIDWFPKANRVLIRKDNKWIDFGRDWLKKHL